MISFPWGILGAYDSLEELIISHSKLSGLPDLSRMKKLKKLEVDDNRFEKDQILSELLPKGVWESFSFSTDLFPVFNFGGRQFKNLKRLKVEAPSEFSCLLPV